MISGARAVLKRQRHLIKKQRAKGQEAKTAGSVEKMQSVPAKVYCHHPYSNVQLPGVLVKNLLKA